MKPLVATFAVICTVALSGCSNELRPLLRLDDFVRIRKPGFTIIQWEKDLAQCENEARAKALDMDPKEGRIMIEISEMRNDCLFAKGYYSPI